MPDPNCLLYEFNISVEWIKANRFTGDELIKHRKDFWNFVKEHDRRRGTDFKKAFDVKFDESKNT